MIFYEWLKIVSLANRNNKIFLEKWKILPSSVFTNKKKEKSDDVLRVACREKMVLLNESLGHIYIHNFVSFFFRHTSRLVTAYSDKQNSNEIGLTI